jgi:hypothetical protein
MEVTELNETKELQVIAQNSGIEKQQAETITSKYVPFLQAIHEITEQANRIDWENPSELDEKIARELRLKLVPNRTAADKFKASEKATYLLINGIHDGAYKIVENTSKLWENKLAAVEKQREIKEKERKEKLRLERIEAIKDLTEDANIYPLSEMTDSSFEDLKNGLELAAIAKKEAAEKAEIERKQQEEREKELKDRTDELIIAGFSFDGNNYFVSDFKVLGPATIISLQKSDFDAIVKAGKNELQRLKDAEAKKLKDAHDAKAKADAELAEEKRLAKIESDKQAAIIAKQKEESDKLAAELKAKADAEEAESKRIEAERLAKIAEEKKKAKAPDKDKLVLWIDSIQSGHPHDLKLKDAEIEKVANDIYTKFIAFRKWAFEQTEKL